MTEQTKAQATTPAEITYSWQGDYLIPDIGIPEDEDGLPSLTKWGMMRKDYLQKHRRIIYTDMKLSGKLFLHCHEIEEQAKNRMELMMKRLTEANPQISEELKAKDPMAWVGQMNALKAQAEEVIKTELIYN
jgi:hypothetical protein